MAGRRGLTAWPEVAEWLDAIGKIGFVNTETEDPQKPRLLLEGRIAAEKLGEVPIEVKLEFLQAADGTSSPGTLHTLVLRASKP